MSGAIIVAAFAATAIQAYGQYQAGKAAEAQAIASAKQARAEAAWHDYNAKIALREAEAERQAAAFEAQQQAREAKQLKARQRAIVGASGVTAEGSPLLVMEDTAAQLALENAMIRMRGARGVARWRSQSILDVGKAGMARSRAAGFGQAAVSARKAGAIGAGTSILGGVADIGYMGYKMGMWGQKKT